PTFADNLPLERPVEREVPTKQLIKQVKAEAKARQEKKKIKTLKADLILSNPPAPVTSVNLNRPLAIGFYVNWDDSSYASLKRNISELDWLVPEWVRLSDDANNPLVLDIDQNAIDLIHQEKPLMPILPLVQNYKNEQWNSELLARAIDTEDARQNLIKALLEM